MNDSDSQPQEPYLGDDGKMHYPGGGNRSNDTNANSGTNSNLKDDLELTRRINSAKEAASKQRGQRPAKEGEESASEPAEQSINQGARSEENTHRNDSVSSIRTYEMDTKQYMQNEKPSAASIALQEQATKREAVKEARREAQANDVARKQSSSSSHPFRRAFAIIAGVLLLVAALGVVGYVGYITLLVPDEITSNIEPSSFFFTESSEAITVTDSANPTMVQNRIDDILDDPPTTVGGVTQIFFTRPIEDGNDELLGTDGFLFNTGTSFPASLTRWLSDAFMFGVFVLDQQYPFLVFKTDSYEDAFAGMLRFESSMTSSLEPLFGEALRPNANPQIATSSTDRPNNPPQSGQFEDRIIQNKDTRVLEHPNGSTQLIYSFVTNDTLVITTDESALVEIFNRLQRVRFQQ